RIGAAVGTGNDDHDVGGTHAARGDPSLRDELGEDTCQPDRKPHTGELTADELTGEVLVAPARADAPVLGVVVEGGLVDRAGVVVQATGDRQVGDDTALGQIGKIVPDDGEFGQPLLEQFGLHTQGPDLIGHGRAGALHTRQPQTGIDLFIGQPVGEQDLPDTVVPDLVQFVHGTDDHDRVLDPQPFVEALQHLAVVDAERPGRDVQTTEYPVDDAGQFGIEVQRYGVDVDHVDVALGEFAEATLLGALSPPDPLHLVTLEWKGQLVEVLGDVPGEGHGQVEVQPESGVRIVLAVRLEPVQGVDLLGGLALGHQRLQVLHGRGLDRGEAEGLEACADMVQPLLLHGPDLGRPLGETDDGSGADDALIGHVSFSDLSERVCTFVVFLPTSRSHGAFPHGCTGRDTG